LRRSRETSSGEPPDRQKTAATPDGRETQMISLADQLAEKQLREGTASAQVITHYLKLGSSRERLEQEKLTLETELVKAKTEAIAGQQRQEEMFAKAIKYMRAYQGGELSDEPEESFE
jgi:chorismate synthase